jgi:hypothetical protein
LNRHVQPDLSRIVEIVRPGSTEFPAQLMLPHPADLQGFIAFKDDSRRSLAETDKSIRRKILGKKPRTSVIPSVIALAKSENRRKQMGPDDTTRKRQVADIMRVVLKMPVFVGVSENCGKDSLPPSHTKSPVFLITCSMG